MYLCFTVSFVLEGKLELLRYPVDITFYAILRWISRDWLQVANLNGVFNLSGVGFS